MKINKHRRLKKIIQILERWAPLETSEISQSLANLFDVDESEIKRNVANDLKFLRDEGELIALYFNKFGKLISKELEPEGEQFYRLKWQLRSQEEQAISGSHELNQYSSFIMASKELEENLKIRQGVGHNQQDWRYFYFDLNNELYHLALPNQPKSDSKRTLLLLGLCRSRSHYPHELGSDFASFSKGYPDIPRVLLTFKDPFISSIDSEAPILIEFLADGTLNVSGVANKNPLQFLELPSGQAKDLLSYLSILRDKTQTTHWSELKQIEDKDYSTGEGRGLSSPLMLRLKDNSGYLIQ